MTSQIVAFPAWGTAAFKENLRPSAQSVDHFLLRFTDCVDFSDLVFRKFGKNGFGKSSLFAPRKKFNPKLSLRWTHRGDHGATMKLLHHARKKPLTVGTTVPL